MEVWTRKITRLVGNQSTQNTKEGIGIFVIEISYASTLTQAFAAFCARIQFCTVIV